MKRAWVVVALFAASIAGVTAQSSIELTPIYGLGDDPTLDLAAVLEISAQFNDRILQTVYWALGVVVTVLAVIMGFNWFVGMRSFERDREALQATIAAELAALDARLTAKVDEGLRSGTSRIAETAADLGGKVNSELSAIQEAFRAYKNETDGNLASNDRALQDALEKSRAQIAEQIEVASKTAQQAIISGDAGLRQNIAAVKDALSLFEMEMSAYRWKADNVPANEITYRVKYVLELIRREHGDYVIISQLERIEELIAKGAHRTSPDAANKLVNELPDKFSTFRSRLTEALSKPRGS
jgi:hypothetical protein